MSDGTEVLSHHLLNALLCSITHDMRRMKDNCGSAEVKDA